MAAEPGRSNRGTSSLDIGEVHRLLEGAKAVARELDRVKRLLVHAIQHSETLLQWPPNAGPREGETRP